MKTYTPIIISLILCLALIDFGASKQVKIEMGSVAYKMLVKPGSLKMMNDIEPTHYGIVIVQSDKQRAYFFGVDKQTFDKIDPGHRVPIQKSYTFITKIEYNSKLKL